MNANFALEKLWKVPLHIFRAFHTAPIWAVTGLWKNNAVVFEDAEDIAVSEGHSEMAELIHQAKHQKPSRHYNNIKELIASVHQKSDEKVLQRLQEELRHENNKCLG